MSEFNYRFEFDLRIKFAVDNERKLQEKIWQTKFDKLKEDYEQEKGLMTKFYEEGRAILCNSLSNKFSIETNKMIDKAVEDAEYKKDLKCTEFLNQELAGQHDQHAENLRNTMRFVNISHMNMLV